MSYATSRAASPSAPPSRRMGARGSSASADTGEDTNAPDKNPVVSSANASGSNFETAEGDALFRLWRETGDESAREGLILLHRNLVISLARRYAGKTQAFDDVLQVGMVGLINALDAFDSSRGLKFSTFATPTVAGEIRRYFRDKEGSVRMPRRMHQLQYVIARAIENLTQQLDRSPTYAEVGRSLGLDAQEVAEAIEMAYALDVASLDEPAQANEEGGSLADRVGAHDPDLEAWGEHAALQAALEKLSSRSRQVLELVYFQGFSQAEAARRLSVSQMCVSRVQRRALAELRKLLDEV